MMRQRFAATLKALFIDRAGQQYVERGDYALYYQRERMGYNGEDRNGATHEHHSTTDKTYKPRQGVSSVSLRIWVLCQVKAGLTGVYTRHFCATSPDLL